MIKKKKLIMIVNDDKLYLLISNQKGPGHIIGTIPFGMTSVFDDFSCTIPVQARKTQDNLLVLPDYFIDNAMYSFTSGKRSIAEAFIQRKLSESYPAGSEISNFFNYKYTRIGQDTGGLYVFFPQDPAFFKLYQWLVHGGIQPDLITTPAFIWRHVLEKIDDTLFNRNLCLIHALPSESHLYFFMQGNFLFSRSIKFPEPFAGAEEILESLAYEITQSAHLFSQKVKSEIKGFYLVSTAEAGMNVIDEKRLAERIEKDVRRIDINRKKDSHSEEADQPLSGPLEAFSWHDLESEKVLTFSHRQTALRKAWDPVQRVGMITGFLVLLFLCGVSLFLNFWINKKFLPETRTNAKEVTINRRAIAQYNELLDTIINERQQPDPAALLAGVIMSLPQNATILELSFNLESPFQIAIKGQVETDSPELLRSSLSQMVEGLTRRLNPARSPSLGDIRLDMEKGDSATRSLGYFFTMQMDLK